MGEIVSSLCAKFSNKPKTDRRQTLKPIIRQMKRKSSETIHWDLPSSAHRQLVRIFYLSLSRSIRLIERFLTCLWRRTSLQGRMNERFSIVSKSHWNRVLSQLLNISISNGLFRSSSQRNGLMDRIPDDNDEQQSSIGWTSSSTNHDQSLSKIDFDWEWNQSFSGESFTSFH